MYNPFEILYKQKAEILELRETGAYSKQCEWKRLAVIKADIQPYGGELAEMEYGLKEDCRMRMFCNEAEYIKAGNYVRYEEKLYRISYAARWRYGMEVLLNEHIG